MNWLAETRNSYDTVATNYAGHVRGSLDESPMLRALVVMFAELVRRDGGPVLDIGCGTGHVAGELHSLGLDVIGIDLSPAMVAIARSEHPGRHYDVGSTELPYSDDSAAGALLFWSLIHIPEASVGTVLAETLRVLRPGGIVTVGFFHVGNRVNRKTEGYGGLPMNLDVHHRPVEVVAERLRVAGFRIEATMLLDPDRETPGGVVVARR